MNTKRKYQPSPGGRIEFRFRDKNEKIFTDLIINDIIKKTGMKRDDILVKAVFELNKKYDDRGNLI